MTAAALRVGLIGAGLMGRTHARAWGDLLGAVYVPPGDEGAARFAREFGLRPCATPEELFAQVEIVDLCTPTPTHLTYTLAAARAGRHVICEKPAALSVEDAEAMRLGCEAAGVRLFIAHVLRFFPQYRAAQEQVALGRIGTPRVLRLSRVGSPPGAGSWLHDEAQSGGVPLDLMLHDLDYARWLAGEVGSVYAAQSRQGQLVMVQATLQHTGGAISLIEGGWAAPAGVFRTSLDVAGTLGATEWNSDALPPLRRFGPPAPPHVPDADASAGPPVASLPSVDDDPYAAELHHAYHAIGHGLPFLVTPADAVAAVALGLAVRESLATGRAVVPQAVAGDGSGAAAGTVRL